MSKGYILRKIILGIAFFISTLSFGESINLLQQGGKQSKWSKALNLNLANSDKIAIRIVSQKEAKCTLFLKSGKGGFRQNFTITACEQIIFISKGSFTRENGAKGWSKIENMKLTIQTSAVSANLLSIKALSKGKYLPAKGLYILKPLSRITSVGRAWPVYAIIDKEIYPKKRFQKAGQALALNIKKLYGLKIPINPETIKLKKNIANVVIIGKKAALKAGTIPEDELKKQGFNGFIVNVKNGSLTIAGDSIQGTVYGVYKYLEKNGLKFFTASVFTRKKIAKNHMLAVNFKDKPFFIGKRIFAPLSIYGDTSSFFSLGDVRTAGIDKEYPCDKTLWIDHTAAFLVPKKMYLKEHPEYYTLSGNGKRLSPETPDVRLMLCQTNPGGMKVAAARALKWIESQKERKYFVIQQGDDMEPCFCEGCKKKRAEGWNESDLMLNWINYIAAKVYEKYPDKYLLCYAYVNTQPAPNKLRLAKNVQLLYAPWPNKMSAPNGFRDFDAPENIIAGSQINAWIDKVGAENLGIYDYNSYHILTLRGMASRIKWLAKRGMKGGFWYCGTPQIFRDLFIYVHSQLNWDPFQNVRTLEKEFIRAYYGKAAPVMEKIIESIYDRLDKDDKNNGRIPAPEFFTKNFTLQVLNWFDEAMKLAPKNFKKMLSSDKHYFVINGIFAINPVNRLQVTKEENEVFGLLLGNHIEYGLKKYEAKVASAKKAGKKLPSLNSFVDSIWNLTHVKIETTGLKPGDIPARLLELAKQALVTIKKYQIKDFTKNLADGSVLIPAMAFSGGSGPIYYKWKCEGKVATWVRGTMTEVSSMHADFKLDKVLAEKYELEIEGQDSDKLWCPPVPIQIWVNSILIFEGANGFIKHGWSKRTFKINNDILKQGKNKITIKNLANSDSRSAYWFMISEMKLKISGNK